MNIQSINTAASTVVAQRQASPDSATAVRESALATTPSETTQASQTTQVSRQVLDQAAKAVSDFVKTANSSLEFYVDEETGIDVVKVVDKNTKEVIRQIPSEEIVAIAHALDNLKGLLIHQKA